MKIMLLGEFSSLHRYLKEGLLELGDISVELYANGDSWKGIGGADGELYHCGKGVWGRFKRYADQNGRTKLIKGYDIVQLIHTGVYSSVLTPKIIRRLKDNNYCLSLVAAGGDYALKQAYVEGKIVDYAYDYDKTRVDYYNMHTLQGRLNVKADRSVVEATNVIIPSTYEYTVGYQGNNKLSEVIPFPINLKSIEYCENVVQRKIVFFHGLNRELAKGTPFIKNALQRLQETYPEEVEVVIDGHMPFERYLDVMKRTNVVVDQCCSYGYGINACIAMAQGKVVMSGNRPETREAFGRKDIPVIPIMPNEEQIFEQMKRIVEKRKEMAQMGYESRQYVERVHDHVQVAKRYVDVWKKAQNR